MSDKFWVEAAGVNVWSVLSGEHEADVGEVARVYDEATAHQFAATQDLLEALERLASAFYIDADEPCQEVTNALGDKCHKQPHGHLWFADTCAACRARAAILRARGGK